MCPSYQPLLRLERPVDAVHFVVEPAGVAQVVPGAILPPERRGHGPAVHALPAVPGELLQILWKRDPRHTGQELCPPHRATRSVESLQEGVPDPLCPTAPLQGTIPACRELAFTLQNMEEILYSPTHPQLSIFAQRQHIPPSPPQNP